MMQPYWLIHPKSGKPFATTEMPLKAFKKRDLPPTSVSRIELRHWRQWMAVDYEDGSLRVGGRPFGHFVDGESFAPNPETLEPVAWRRVYTQLTPAGQRHAVCVQYALGWSCPQHEITRYLVLDPDSRRVWLGTA